MKTAFVAAAICFVSCPSLAESAAKGTAPAPAFGQAYCTAPANVFDVVFEDAEMRINNVNLGQETPPLSTVQALSVSASFTNKARSRASASLEVYGVANDRVGFAISARPIMGGIAQGQTEQVENWIVLPPEADMAVSLICIRATKFVEPSKSN